VIDEIVTRALAGIPDYRAFFTVDELMEDSAALAADFPDLVERRVIGGSRAGEPIECLKIGRGRRSAVLFAFPHPNEPIGAQMLQYFSRRLCQDGDLRQALDYSWYLVKAVDPDGARLNQGWFKGPFAPLNYALHFYRPGSREQVEWTFPIEYKKLRWHTPLPETKALMALLDEVRPDFVYSLHNAGFGGVYFYVSDPCEPLYPIFHRLARQQGLPLMLGEPEVPYATRLAEAVYRMPSTRDTYDFLEQYAGGDPTEIIRAGTSSLDYVKARRPDAFVLVCEMPYYYDPRIEDARPAETRRRDAVLTALAAHEKDLAEWQGYLDAAAPHLTGENPFRAAVASFTAQGRRALEAHRRWAESHPDLDRPATVAELFDSRVLRRFYNLLILGMVRRMALHQLGSEQAGSPEAARVLRSLADEVEAGLRARAAELEREMDYTVIPVRKLVGVQLASALHTAWHIQSRQR